MSTADSDSDGAETSVCTAPQDRNVSALMYADMAPPAGAPDPKDGEGENLEVNVTPPATAMDTDGNTITVEHMEVEGQDVEKAEEPLAKSEPEEVGITSTQVASADAEETESGGGGEEAVDKPLEESESGGGEEAVDKPLEESESGGGEQAVDKPAEESESGGGEEAVDKRPEESESEEVDIFTQVPPPDVDDSESGGGELAVEESESPGGDGEPAVEESESPGGGGEPAVEESESPGGGGEPAVQDSESGGDGEQAGDQIVVKSEFGGGVTPKEEKPDVSSDFASEDKPLTSDNIKEEKKEVPAQPILDTPSTPATITRTAILAPRQE